VTLVPAYFVYKNITNTPGWDSSDLRALFYHMSYWPLVIGGFCGRFEFYGLLSMEAAAGSPECAYVVSSSGQIVFRGIVFQ
jgi:hypothetical protein